jgi:hypothetical protein
MKKSSKFLVINEIQIKTTVILSHSSQTDHHQENKQMLGRMWGKGNLHTLFVGI